MYIFGYGSLMNSASRQLTGNTGKALPATVHGLVRYWGKIDDSYVISPLVVNPGEGQVNGVLLEIDEAALAEFDRRERGYQRIALTAEQIETEAEFDREREIWVYVTEQHQPPCERSPIVQTYVDTVLAAWKCPKHLLVTLSNIPSAGIIHWKTIAMRRNMAIWLGFHPRTIQSLMT